LQGSKLIVVSKIQLSKLFIEINPIPSYMLKSYFLDIFRLLYTLTFVLLCLEIYSQRLSINFNINFGDATLPISNLILFGP